MEASGGQPPEPRLPRLPGFREMALRRMSEDRRRLVGELSVASPEFARFWADYRLFEHTHGTKRFFHPAVGEMQLNYEALPLPGDGGQMLVVYNADKGSPSEEKLALLSSWSATPIEPEPSERVDQHR